MTYAEQNMNGKNIKHRVLLVVRWPVGGIRTFILYVYSHFDPDKYHFTILAPASSGLDMLEKDLSELDLEIVRISDHPSFYDLILAATRLLNGGRYDLVHSHGFTSGLCTVLPALVFRIPHILTSHDTLSTAQFKGYSGRIKLAVMGFALSLVNTIHLVSEDALTNLGEFYPRLASKAGKCVVIRNGIPSEVFVNALPRDLRAELGVDSNVFLIGFLGRFMSLKGFSFLVDAVGKLVDAGGMAKKPLVLAFGEGGFVREEKSALEARGLEEYFIFYPFTSNVAGVIKGLDLVVVPSLSETCPLLPMEVLTCGIPILTSNCVGLREVVRNTPAHMVPSRNSAAIAEEIRRSMKEETRQCFLDFAPEAAERFDVVKTASAIKIMYSKYL